jgi:hypothetical protein
VSSASASAAAQDQSPAQLLAGGSVLADSAVAEQITVELRNTPDARLQLTFRDGMADRLLPMVAQNARSQGFSSLTLIVLGSTDEAAWLGVNDCGLYAGCLRSFYSNVGLLSGASQPPMYGGQMGFERAGAQVIMYFVPADTLDVGEPIVAQAIAVSLSGTLLTDARTGGMAQDRLLGAWDAERTALVTEGLFDLTLRD